MANTLRIGAGMGLRLWRGADMTLNYERVVAKPASEPYSQTVRLTVRQALVARSSLQPRSQKARFRPTPGWKARFGSPSRRRTTAICVRREKAALSSGCKSHPANAPAGSNRSSHGGDEMAEAFGVAGHI